MPDAIEYYTIEYMTCMSTYHGGVSVDMVYLNLVVHVATVPGPDACPRHVELVPWPRNLHRILVNGIRDNMGVVLCPAVCKSRS